MGIKLDWNKLKEHLEGLAKTHQASSGLITIELREIARIVGADPAALPDYFYKPRYWHNGRSNKKACAWKSAGFEVVSASEINNRDNVMFRIKEESIGGVKTKDESIGEFYEIIQRNIQSYFMSGAGLGSLFSHPLGYPLEELVGIGRAFYLSALPIYDQIRCELCDIAKSLFNLSAKQGNCFGEFYYAYYRDVYESQLLEKIYIQENENEFEENCSVLAEIQQLASKVLVQSDLHEAKLILAYAYYFGCGVARNRDKAEEYLKSGLLEIYDTGTGYEFDRAMNLATTIGREHSMENRKKVFISYSHKDSQYEEELRLHLDAMAYSGIVEYWDDSHLNPGSPIDKTIADEMAKAKFIIMLVSPDYMASWYVRKKEFDTLINAAITEGAIIYWVPVRKVLVKGTALDSINAIFDKNKSLASTRDFPERSDRDMEYAKIAEHIYNALNPDAQ